MSTKSRLPTYKLTEVDPESKQERIAHTKAVQEALIARVGLCKDEEELQALKLEMEALPLVSFHHMARMNVWDSMRKRLGEIYR